MSKELVNEKLNEADTILPYLLTGDNTLAVLAFNSMNGKWTVIAGDGETFTYLEWSSFIDDYADGDGEYFIQPLDELASITSTDAYRIGCAKGRHDGYDAGYDAGYDNGYNAGYDTGYDNGYDQAFDVGYESAF